MNAFKTSHLHYLPRRRAARKTGVDPYPLLGVLLLLLTAALAYGSLYFLLT